MGVTIEGILKSRKLKLISETAMNEMLIYRGDRRGRREINFSFFNLSEEIAIIPQKL